MTHYQSFSKALNDIRKRGYTYNFDLKSELLECPLEKLQIHLKNYKVDETFRFEGMSRDGDNLVLYAISFNTYVKGLLSNVNIVCTENNTKVIRNTIR